MQGASPVFEGACIPPAFEGQRGHATLSAVRPTPPAAHVYVLVPACVLRPCEERDLPDLRRLIASISGNLTSLPKENSFIEQKVFRSLRAFDRRTVKPGDDHYLFVLEDTAGRGGGRHGGAHRAGRGV